MILTVDDVMLTLESFSISMLNQKNIYRGVLVVMAANSVNAVQTYNVDRHLDATRGGYVFRDRRRWFGATT